MLHSICSVTVCMFARLKFPFQFGTTVDGVDPIKVKSGWKGLAWDITSSDSVDRSKSIKERFDAVMVCNGCV